MSNVWFSAFGEALGFGHVPIAWYSASYEASSLELSLSSPSSFLKPQKYQSKMLLKMVHEHARHHPEAECLVKAWLQQTKASMTWNLQEKSQVSHFWMGCQSQVFGFEFTDELRIEL